MLNPGNAAGKWRRVTPQRPCPACGKTNWCTLSADGRLAACRRVEAGAWRTKTGKDGTPIYLHRLNGAATISPAELPATASGTAARIDAGTLHRVYSAMLAGLSLAQSHRESLHRRGLADADIDSRGYRTLPKQGRARCAAELRERFGDTVLRVPGIVTKEREGRRYLTVAGVGGLLIPCRDIQGRVVALKIRRDDDGPGPRYSYLSSARHGGPGPGSPVHFPLGTPASADLVRVTEGELKADVAVALSGVPTISIPGALCWRPALDAAKALGARTVRLALDADAADKPAVGRALDALAHALDAAELAVEFERWRAPHKGIDDALAAGAALDVLTGNVARQAIAETLAEATVGEPPQEPTALDRLAERLAEGPAALFRDGELLRALAAVAENDPAEFACVRSKVKAAAGVSLRDLDKALAHFRQEVRRQRPPADAAGQYRSSAGRIVRDAPTPQGGTVEIALCNFDARIVEQVTVDDGVERRSTLAVEGALADGTPLPRVDIPADQFAYMRWPVEKWGTRAVVLAGMTTADHLRCAMQLLSGDVTRREVFAHTGWREVAGQWVYLHATGAIGAAGPVDGVEVSLPDAVAGYSLPTPPQGAELADAVRASLAILDVGPERVTAPLVAAVFRAAITSADFSLHLAGPSSAGKTELAALVQQHFGAGLDARHLPGSWASTANSLEGLAFAAKDAVFVVDDFAPQGGQHDVARYHREADRLLRAQGNQAGRSRCRADGTVKAAKPPRGLIVSTGEDVPRGQSLRSRMLICELSPGEVNWQRLTICQRDAANGLYAAAMAGYLRWLSGRYAALRDGLRAEIAALRDKAHLEGQHKRTPGIIADLAAGLRHFLDYAVEAGAIDTAERDALAKRSWAALLAASAEQAGHVEAAEPTGHFLRLLAAVLESWRAHVADAHGDAPQNAPAWGWRLERGEWHAQGPRVGWLDGADLFLQPDAAFAAAQRLASEQGESLPVGARTLWQRCRERGLLASWDKTRQRHTVRRHLDGPRREVLHLRADALCSAARPSQPSPNHEKHGQSGDGCAGDSPDRPANRPQVGPENTTQNGEWDGWDGQKQGDRPACANNFAPRQRGTV
jgi:hypothetical protein